MPTNRYRKPLLWGIFALYGCFLLFLMFFSRTVLTDYTLLQHFQRTTNLVPFHTILDHGRGLLEGIRSLLGEGHPITWQLRYYGQNLLGNLVMFLPFGLLASCLLPKCNRLWKLILLTVGVVVTAEIAQGLLRVGCIDVDDLILNTVGAIAGYLILKIPPVCRFLRGEQA